MEAALVVAKRLLGPQRLNVVRLLLEKQFLLPQRLMGMLRVQDKWPEGERGVQKKE